MYKVGLFTLLKEVLWYFFPRGLAESFDKHRPMEKLNRAESSPILHTSFTLRMQSRITTDARLRNHSEALPALILDEQEIPIRHLGKGIPGCLCGPKAIIENIPECGWPASLFALFIMQRLGEDAEKSTKGGACSEGASQKTRGQLHSSCEPSQVFGSDTLLK